MNPTIRETPQISLEEMANNWVTWLKALASGEYKKGISLLHFRTLEEEQMHPLP